jgi:hypothetical protein
VVRFSLPSDADGMLICGEVLVEWMYDADGDSQQHLSRMEESQRLRPHRDQPVLYKAYAWRAANRVKVPYKSFWNLSSFTRVEVEAYLAWLDAGNHGTHFDWSRTLPKTRDRQAGRDSEI